MQEQDEDELLLRMAIQGALSLMVEWRGKLNQVRGTSEAEPVKKRKISEEGKASIAAAQRARWAALRKPKRKMSAAGRQAIIEATRKRWAEFHRQKALSSKISKDLSSKASKEKPGKRRSSREAQAAVA